MLEVLTCPMLGFSHFSLASELLTLSAPAIPASQIVLPQATGPLHKLFPQTGALFPEDLTQLEHPLVRQTFLTPVSVPPSCPSKYSWQHVSPAWHFSQLYPWWLVNLSVNCCYLLWAEHLRVIFSLVSVSPQIIRRTGNGSVFGHP